MPLPSAAATSLTTSQCRILATKSGLKTQRRFETARLFFLFSGSSGLDVALSELFWQDAEKKQCSFVAHQGKKKIDK